MATKYILSDINGNPIMEFARKVTAIKQGDERYVAYTVVTNTGKVVHEVDNREQQTTEATPAPENKEKQMPTATKKAPAKKTAAKKTAAPAAVKTNDVVYTDDHGAKRFFPAMAEGLITLAKAQGLTATADNANRVVKVEANATETKALQKTANAVWPAAWAAFKEWKKDSKVKAKRKEQWATNDGKRQMFADESAFLTKQVAAGDVL